MANWKRIVSMLVAVFMLLTMPIMTGISRTIAEDTAPQDGTLTITKKNVGGDQDDAFNFIMDLTIDPETTSITIDTLTEWIDNFLKDGGQLFSDEEKQAILQKITNYLLGHPAGELLELQMHFTLKGGEKATIEELDGGVAYKITEEGTEGYTPAANGQTGELGGSLTVTGVIDGNKTIAFKNTFGKIHENGTLTITKKNIGGDPEDEFNYTMKLTIDPSVMELSISTVTSWIDKFLKDGGQLFTEEEANSVLTQLIDYLLGYTGSAGDPIVITAHFTLKDGDVATIQNLEGGIAYEITEEGTEGYTPSANGQTGELGGDLKVSGVVDGNKTIVFKNTFGEIADNGTLTITKKNIGGDPDDEFNYNMKLTIDPSAMELSISTVTSWIDKFLKDGGQLFTEEEANSVLTQLIDYLLGYTGSAGDPIVINAHFTLKDGDVATIQNLEGGIVYEITEEGTEGYTPSANGQTAAIGEDLTVSGVIDGNKTIAFKNTFGTIPENGTLTISKTNDGGDPDDEFSYNMKLTIDPSAMDLSISTVTSWIDKFLKDGGQLFTEEEANSVLTQLIDYLLGYTGSAGDPIVINAHFTLKDGDVATIQNLEGGITYEITEEGTEGYTPSANGQTAAIGEDLTVSGVIDGNKTIAFKNTFGTIPENGTLTISKTNAGGNQNDVFNYTMNLTIDPSVMDLSISTVTSWIDKFLRDGGQLFTDEEKNRVLTQLIDYLLGYTGSAGDPIVINANFTLKGGETATILNLEGGIAYEITEAGTEGYVPTANGQAGLMGGDLTVTGVIDGDTTIAFVNTFEPDPGTLTISKTNVEGDPDDVFNYTMTLTLDPNAMHLSISTVTSWIDKFLKDGGQLFTEEEANSVLTTLINALLSGNTGEPIVVNAHFTLKGGETATIQNLEAGIAYVITEEGTEGYRPSANGSTGRVGSSLTVTGVIDGDQDVAFTNTYIGKNGTLTIAKKNIGGDPDDVFNYNMKLTIDPSVMDLSISTVTSWIDKFLKDGGQLFTEEEANSVLTQLIDYLLGYTGSAGDPIVINAHFTLKGGETAAIQNLEGGIVYEITEAGTEGYTPAANGQTGELGGELTVTGVVDGNKTIVFKNTLGTIPENGTLTISKTNVDGNPDDEFNFAMKLTIDPSAMELSISTVTSWIDKFLKDGGQLFTEEEANSVLTQLIDYLLGYTGSAGDPIVINAHFTLKGGETATIQNMEGGIAYEITEEGTANYTPSANGETGTLGGELTVSGVIDGDAAVAFTNTYTQPADPKFKRHSIVMSGSIGVNFFMDLNTLSDEEKEAGYMTFEISGKGTITDRDDFDPNFKNTTNEYYGFTCFINSIQMADTITATYHYCDGQTKSETYSIKQYLTAIDKNVSSFEADMVSLLHALGDFGHYVQPFLAEEKGWTIGEDYAEMDKYYTETYDLDAVREAVAAKEAVRGTNDDIEAVNFTLVLDSETAIKVFFKLADEYTGTFKATLGSGTENVAQLQEDGRYMVLIPKIRAQQLGNTYTIKATTESGTAVSKISGLSYAQAILNSPAFADNTNALNAMSALYFYYLRAHEYTTAHAN